MHEPTRRPGFGQARARRAGRAGLDGDPPAGEGLRRGAHRQVTYLAPRAAAAGRVVIAPHFDEARWRRYQQVVRHGRADLALLALMDELRAEGVWRTQRFDLSGFSGGAQFAHRFALLHPGRVGALTVASAGWWTFPDDAPFPYGFGPGPGRDGTWGPQMAGNLDAFLRRPIRVCVGAWDAAPDANTRRGPGLDRQQGRGRLARARRWTDALRAEARARGIDARLSFEALPGCGHDFATCVETGGLDRLIVDGATQHHPEETRP